MLTAVRVHYGSCEPEWSLYMDGKYIGYWCEYHRGPLPLKYVVYRGGE